MKKQFGNAVIYIFPYRKYIKTAKKWWFLWIWCQYSRRWGEFRMQVIAYKVWLLIRYKYTMEFQKILLSLFRAWSVAQKPPMRVEIWMRNFMLIKKKNNLMGKKSSYKKLFKFKTVYNTTDWTRLFQILLSLTWLWDVREFSDVIKANYCCLLNSVFCEYYKDSFSCSINFKLVDFFIHFMDMMYDSFFFFVTSCAQILAILFFYYSNFGLNYIYPVFFSIVSGVLDKQHFVVTLWLFHCY